MSQIRTIVACFQVKSYCIDKNQSCIFLQNIEHAHILAWTTTPWTLPSNTALTVGPKIEYALLASFNPYTKEQSKTLFLAKELISKWFKPEAEVQSIDELKIDDKLISYYVIGTCIGSDLKDIEYNQLLPFEANLPKNIYGDSFKVITGDFVTTTDGTGIVHTAPSFGVDDRKVAGENGIGELKMVDMEGKFIDGMGYLSHRFVKDYRNEPEYKSPDVDIAIDLKTKGLAFNVQKICSHSLPSLLENR